MTDEKWDALNDKSFAEMSIEEMIAWSREADLRDLDPLRRCDFENSLFHKMKEEGRLHPAHAVSSEQDDGLGKYGYPNMAPYRKLVEATDELVRRRAALQQVDPVLLLRMIKNAARTERRTRRFRYSKWKG